MSFNREDFSLRSKSELLDYIEQQCEQISRLENRFRGEKHVVRAYRGIIKEKEALEASFKVLSEMGRGEEGEETEEERGEGEGEGVDSGVEKSSESGEREGEKEGGEEGGRQSEAESSEKETLAPEKKSLGDAALVSSLRQQLLTLTSSLQTLNEERAKMEASFLRDKKSMLTQQDSLSRQLHSERQQMEEEIRKLQTALQETQSSLRSERKHREEEQATHADMLKELQSLIISERDGKEALGLQMQELEVEALALRGQLSETRLERDREQEEVTQSLSLQVQNLQAELQLAERKSSQPSAQLIQLQREMERLKEDHAKSLLLEQQRAADFEERLSLQSQHEEQTVASLETKMSQLSEAVGSYVQLREQDQTTMQKLKERITQLDSENTSLTRSHVERQEANTQTAGHVNSLQEKVARLKAFLKIATTRINEKASVPANLEEMSVGEYRDLLGKEMSGKEYQHELSQLKEEFERYKTRAQTVLRSKDNKDPTPPVPRREVHSLQSRVSELQNELHSLHSKRDEDEERHLLTTQRLREEMREMADRSRAEVASMETQHKEKLQDLHHHVQSTRERTMKLLAERDAEIQHLRGELQALMSHSYSHSGGLERSLSHVSTASSGHEPVAENGSDDSLSIHQTPSGKLINLSTRSTESISAVQEIMEQPSPAPVGEPKLLHFLQEQQRRDNELATVRRRRLELEDTMRDLQEREQRHLEQGAFLKDQIRKLERDRSRETENLEYLKNVIFHFMCSDSYGREQMVPPVATILHFSPDEVRLIKEKMAARRWIPRKTT